MKPMEHWQELADRVRRATIDEAGVTALEYALIAALIFLLIVVSVGQVGGALDTIFANVAAAF